MKQKINKNTITILKEDPLFDPRCCTYKLPGKIRNSIEDSISNDDTDEQVKTTLIGLMNEDEVNKNTLTYDSLVKLHQYIQRADQDYSQMPFYKFSELCKCIKPQARENKQLDDRLKLLRLKSSQAIYDQMISTVDKRIEDKLNRMADGEMSKSKLDGDGNLSTFNIYSNNNSNNQSRASEFKRLNGSVVAVFNSFLVFICTFVFCYKALEYSLPQPNIIAQTLFGIGGSTIVAIAELYFLIRVV